MNIKNKVGCFSKVMIKLIVHSCSDLYKQGLSVSKIWLPSEKFKELLESSEAQSVIRKVGDKIEFITTQGWVVLELCPLDTILFETHP